MSEDSRRCNEWEQSILDDDMVKATDADKNLIALDTQKSGCSRQENSAIPEETPRKN